MKTTVIGRGAEGAVAIFLTQHGYKILDRNWRTRWCEVDIIALKNKVVYFIEVKYRINDSQGSGFDYIGPQKLRQLMFAAEFWTSQKNWTGDYRLLAASVSGLDEYQIKIIEVE